MTSRQHLPLQRRPSRPLPKGYVLLEIIIALTVFSISVAGLAAVLHASLDAANLLHRQAAIRRGLDAILSEARAKPRREDMPLSSRDDSLGVEFRTEIEAVQWSNRDGLPVKGLYLLRATATDPRASHPLHDSAQLYVYRP